MDRSRGQMAKQEEKRVAALLEGAALSAGPCLGFVLLVNQLVAPLPSSWLPWAQPAVPSGSRGHLSYPVQGKVQSRANERGRGGISSSTTLCLPRPPKRGVQEPPHCASGQTGESLGRLG